LPTMWQASRRAWQLMQPKECKVFYGFYKGTMPERAMELMGKKLLAAEALEGKFSSEWLVAMAGDDGIELAMVFCDGAFKDPFTNKHTLIGTFAAIAGSQFPVVHPQVIV